MRLRFLVPISVLAVLLAGGCFETSYDPQGIIVRDSIQYSVRDSTPFPSEVFIVKPKPVAWDSLTVCLESEAMRQCRTGTLGYRYPDYKDFLLTTDKFSPAYRISYVAFKRGRQFDTGSFAFAGAGRPARANVPEQVEIGDPEIRIRFKLDYSDSSYHAGFKIDGKEYTQIRGIDFFARNASVKFIGYHPRFPGKVFLMGDSAISRVPLDTDGGNYEIRIDSVNAAGNRIDLIASRLLIILSLDTALQHQIRCYDSNHDALILQWNSAKVRPSGLKDEGGRELDLDPAIVLPLPSGYSFLIIDRAKNGYVCPVGASDHPPACRTIPHILP